MYSTRTMTPDDWRRLRHFTPNEFAAPLLMGYQFMRWLDELRERANVPIHITSSYRTPAHNAAVGGATDSAHTDIPCNAVDIGERPRPDDPHWNRTRWAIITTAIQLGCQRIGTYSDGSLHLDMTHHQRPAPRMWRMVSPTEATPSSSLLELRSSKALAAGDNGNSSVSQPSSELEELKLKLDIIEIIRDIY